MWPLRPLKEGLSSVIIITHNVAFKRKQFLKGKACQAKLPQVDSKHIKNFGAAGGLSAFYGFVLVPSQFECANLLFWSLRLDGAFSAM